MSFVDVGEFLEFLGDPLMLFLLLLLLPPGLSKDEVEPTGEMFPLGTGEVFPCGGSELGDETGLAITGKAVLG